MNFWNLLQYGVFLVVVIALVEAGWRLPDAGLRGAIDAPRRALNREIVTLSHRALDRAVFADGALAAALWVADKPPGLYSMRDVLGL